MNFYRDFKNAFRVTLVYLFILAALVGVLYMIGYNAGIGTDEFVQAIGFVLAEFMVEIVAYYLWYRHTNRAIAGEIFNDEMVRIAHEAGTLPMVVSLVLSGAIAGIALLGASMGYVFADLDNMAFVAVAVSAEAIIGNILLILFIYPAVGFAGPGRISGQY